MVTQTLIDKIFNIFLPLSTPEERSRGAVTPIGNEIELKRFEDRLFSCGISTKSDPRLKKSRAWVENWKNDNLENNRACSKITRAQFYDMLKDDNELELVSKALKGELVIPDFSNFKNDIHSIFKNVLTNLKEKHKTDPNAFGKNASYIPQLANVDPNYWGISVCTIDGQRYNVGNTNIPFTVQSTSKAISYAIALSEYGEERVHEHIGQEPSGRLFNDISLDRLNRPHNPMINAGAIMAISLIKAEKEIGDRYDFIVNNFRKAAGYEHLSFNASVFLSERESADRNNCLAYFMKESNCYKPKKTSKKKTVDGLPDYNRDAQGNVIFGQTEAKFKESLELYFQICSQQTTAESSSVIAGTLANGGICPTTNEKVFEPAMIKHVLSLMMTCGMYDYSGEFAFSVGLPAKSGVGGSIIIVIPNVMGICCFSPPLDAIGNSVKGVEFASQLVKKFAFHNFDNFETCNKTDPRLASDNCKNRDHLINVLFSAMAGDLAQMMEYCCKKFDFNLADYDDRTALHILACGGHIECMKYICYNAYVDVDPRVKDRWGNSPLDEAVKAGHEKCIRFLTILIDKWNKGVKPVAERRRKQALLR